MTKTQKSQSRPETLAKLGRASGVELSESELGQAAGGTGIYYKFEMETLQTPGVSPSPATRTG